MAAAVSAISPVDASQTRPRRPRRLASCGSKIFSIFALIPVTTFLLWSDPVQKFKVLRIVLIGAVLAVAGGLFMLTRDHLALDRESSAFVKDSVVAIGSHWDAGELWQRATPHFREATREADLREQFAAANKALGPLVEYRAVGGKTNFLYAIGDKPLTADYIVRAAFANGEADLEVHAVRSGSTWRIDSFSIGASPEMRKLLGMQG
jgi:hypothetical protein